MSLVNSAVVSRPLLDRPGRPYLAEIQCAAIIYDEPWLMYQSLFSDGKSHHLIRHWSSQKMPVFPQAPEIALH